MLEVSHGWLLTENKLTLKLSFFSSTLVTNSDWVIPAS